MSAKYIITHIDGRLVSAEYDNNILSPTGVMGNIYAGRVENVVKNINCAFVEIEKGVKCYFPLEADNNRHIFFNNKNNDKLNQGDSVLVQVIKEAVKTKPPTVTGKYVVLSSDIRGVNISSKTKKDEMCKKVQSLLLESLNTEKFGFIVRTNCKDVNESDFEDILKEAHDMSQKFENILQRATYEKAPVWLYKEKPLYVNHTLDNKFLEDLYVKELNCHFPNDYIDEIITDDDNIYDTICAYLPENERMKVRLYKDEMLELYKLYDIKKQLEQASAQKVWLKCGGYIIIEQTEALTSIDVNSGKCISKKSGEAAKEDTVYKVNSEAANEIARQIKLRNLSGIIIIDFINMKSEDNTQKLMSGLRHLFKNDKVTTTLIDITKLGLVEVTRKREGVTLLQALKDTSF